MAANAAPSAKEIIFKYLDTFHLLKEARATCTAPCKQRQWPLTPSLSVTVTSDSPWDHKTLILLSSGFRVFVLPPEFSCPLQLAVLTGTTAACKAASVRRRRPVQWSHLEWTKTRPDEAAPACSHSESWIFLRNNQKKTIQRYSFSTWFDGKLMRSRRRN